MASVKTDHARLMCVFLLTICILLSINEKGKPLLFYVNLMKAFESFDQTLIIKQTNM
jgi:hypothetical protein